MSYRNPRTDYYDALTTSDEPWKLVGGILVVMSFIATPLVALLVPGAAVIALICGGVGLLGGLCLCAVGQYKHNKELKKYLLEERSVRLENSKTYAKGYEKGMEKNGLAYPPAYPVNMGYSADKKVNQTAQCSLKSFEPKLKR